MAEGGIERAKSECARVLRHNSPYSPHSSVQCENISAETCSVMNWLGYGPQIRQARRDAYREFDRLMTAWGRGVKTWITAGSKAEGLTCCFESDTDTMFVIENVLCLEEGINTYTLPRETTVFIFNSLTCYPGHCRLLPGRQDQMIPKPLYDALCDDGYGGFLLSSDLFLNECSQPEPRQGVIRHQRAGPSLPSTFAGVLHEDTVLSLPCHCPSILQRWAARLRHWPLPDIVQKVVSMGAFVTPVGFKGSEYKHVEWRICFNTGETELVHNLNDTQVKIYVMLKMIVKEVLKPRKKEITSYTMKNIVFWLAEKNQHTLFHERSLFHWLHEGLRDLRTAIATIQLPYYMIPERNLMAACGLKDNQQRTWVESITDMMNEGPRIILRLEKIRQGVIAHPEPFLWYSKRRVELEILELKKCNRFAQCTDENGVVDECDIIVQEIRRRQSFILREVVQRMYMEGSRVDDVLLLDDILNMMLM